LIVWLSLVAVAPPALLLGGLFVCVVGLAERAESLAPVASTYGAETLGSGAAGAVLGLFLLESLNPVAVITLVGMIAIGWAYYLLWIYGGRRVLGHLGFVLPYLVALAAILYLSPQVDLATRRAQWSPIPVTEVADSRYANIVVTDRDGTHDFYENGVLAFTIPDLLDAEECTHIPLLHHPGPESVLVIGGAGSGVIPEIRRHPTVRHVDFIELDPAVIEMASRYSPQGWLTGDGITVRPVYGDGRRFVAGEPRRYDVVILNVGSPVSLQINRYYTKEFFRQVDRILKRNGILSLKFASEGAYLSPEEASMLAAVADACREVFAHVTLLPGGYIHILASPELDIRARTGVLIETLRLRRLETSFITESILEDRVAPLRMANLDSVMTLFGSGVVNTDAMPVSFPYAISLWAQHFRGGRIISAAVAWLTLGRCLGLLVVIAACVLALHTRLGGLSSISLPAGAAIYSMGFTAMFTEILIILVFQTVSGYIYTRIAAIVAAFMLGMGLSSSVLGVRLRRRRLARNLLLPHLGLAAMPLAVLCGARIASGLADGFFILMAFVAGALGGTVFAAASGVLAGEYRRPEDAGAVAYSLDLTGACVAGFMTGFLIIPSLGFKASAFAVCLFDLAALVPLAISRMALPRAPIH
jgi:spermidine synthase